MKQLKFNADMAQAVKDGRKTQTRRPIKPQPISPGEDHYFDVYNKGDQWNWWTNDGRQNLSQIIKCPYKIGDTHDIDGTQIKITAIRVERLQDISEEDAIAEGFSTKRTVVRTNSRTTVYLNGRYISEYLHYHPDYVDLHLKNSFHWEIWEKLPYKPPYDWNSNPYCWVIEFEAMK